MTFVTNPQRDASGTIAGFVFQVNITILRWLELQEGEHLELECGEDIDTVQDGTQDGISAEEIEQQLSREPESEDFLSQTLLTTEEQLEQRRSELKKGLTDLQRLFFSGSSPG